ncbi:MAG: thiamine pyrophosphate-binding protein [Chloroflexota bacterium]
MGTSERIVQVLLEAGIDHVFGIPGGGIIKVYDALHDVQDKITCILARHEQTAACMADMYGRLTGKPGVFMAQGAFAVSSGLFGIMEAYTASSPMVVLTEMHEFMVFSQHSPYACGTGDHGSVDFKAILKNTTKYTTVAATPVEAVQGTQFAIKHAVSGTPGPTAVLLTGYAITGPLSENTIPRLYPMKGYLQATTSQLHEKDVKAAVDILLGGKEPVIIAGNGVHVSRAYDELKTLAELLAAPVATSFLGKSAFPENHPLALGVLGANGQKIAEKRVGQADVLLVVGTKLKPQDTIFEAPELIDPGRQKIVQIDVDPRNAGWTFPADMGLIGDAKAILAQLGGEVERRAPEAGARSLGSVQKKLLEEKAAADYFEDDYTRAETDPILAPRVLKVLREATEPSAIVTADAGNNRQWMLHYFQTREPRTFFGPGGIIGMSWSLPAAFVAKLLNPGRQCIAVCSDGGFMMQAHILSTAHQYNVPVVFVVLNNSMLGMVREGQGDKPFVSSFVETDHAKIAEAMGCLGFRVEKHKDLRPALDAALRSHRPAVVDVVIDKEDRMSRIFSPLGKEARARVRFRM